MSSVRFSRRPPIGTTSDRIDPEALEKQAGEASRCLKALANAQRLRILCLLVEEELTVKQLNAHLPELSQSALSQHLGRLRAEGMVETRRDSQQIWYRLAEGPAYRLIGTLYDIYCGESGTGPASERRRRATGRARRQRASAT